MSKKCDLVIFKIGTMGMVATVRVRLASPADLITVFGGTVIGLPVELPLLFF